MRVVLAPSPEPKRDFGMREKLAPSPEPKRDFGIRETLPPSPEPTPKRDFGLRAVLPPSSKSKRDFGMRARLPPSPGPEFNVLEEWGSQIGAHQPTEAKERCESRINKSYACLTRRYSLDMGKSAATSKKQKQRRRVSRDRRSRAHE